MTNLVTTYVKPEDKKRIQIEQAQRGLKAENEVITLALDTLERPQASVEMTPEEIRNYLS